jgi:hypothetical protein
MAFFQPNQISSSETTSTIRRLAISIALRGAPVIRLVISVR